MDITYNALIALHLLGIVAIGYGFFKEFARKTYGVNNAMLVGVITELITGVLLYALHESMIADGDEALGMPYMVIKFLLTLAILALYAIGKLQTKQKLYWGLIGVLTLATTVISFVL